MQNIEGLVTLAASKKLGRSINPYNYKQPCDPPPLCSDMTNVCAMLFIFLNQCERSLGTFMFIT